MKLKHYILLTSLCTSYVVLGTSCDDPFEGDTFITPTNLDSEMSCTTAMERRSEDFSLWLDLLKYADYYNGLKDAKATATVFAPTNDAIKEFLAWRGVSSIEELGVDYARSVVQTHIINGTAIDADELVNDAYSGATITNKTLFDGELETSMGHIIVDVDDAERTGEVIDPEIVYINNQAAVQRRDSGNVNSIKTAKSVIYYMDDVIHPLIETIIDKLEQEGEYIIFSAAIRDCGYDTLVSKVRDSIGIVNGKVTYREYPFTCFAPNDEAMNAAGISDLAGLKSKLAESGISEWDYVAYHFFDQRYTKERFFSFDSPELTLIYDTNLKGDVITCHNETVGGVLQPVLNDGVKVTRSDILARNGYIHKVNHWMPVFKPEPVEIKWDFCNTAKIIDFVNAYGNSRDLGNLYYTDLTSSEYMIDLLWNEGTDSYKDGAYGTIDETVFTYKSNRPVNKQGSYRRVGYKKCMWAGTDSLSRTQNAYLDVNTNQPAYLNNLLCINLGYAGWIQLPTPTIIKGKYRVTLHYATEATMKNYHAAGTDTRFQLDPDDAEQAKDARLKLYQGLPTTRSFRFGATDVVLFDNLEFEASGSHQLKVTLLDNSASTDDNYHQLWDYILFTPID